MNDLYHQFRGLDGVYHVLTQGFLLDGVGKGLCYLIVDVGIEECAAHVFERFGNVDFGNSALAFEELETAFKSVG